ncbi:hypothetical protein JKF63_03003 [Porcisia hertigi]|uniref:RRM domain-containing protein n=1 Tax=Porcisia hertigi TaxID=2761500 RepID=A0A836IML1_9TRYP|nr:hypothetical protein JKF63_03003 [Porcisia hertigi]
MSLQNLFVAKLPRNITDADLFNIFSEFCPSSAKIMLDAGTGKSKGFGFVLFDEEEKGARAYRALNRKMTRACGHSFMLVIYPSNHNGKIFTEERNALYIRNIPMSVGEERMGRFLNTFGKLTYFAMRGDHHGNPVWVVYAEYETVQDAKNALTKLHGNNTYFHGAAPILAKFEDSDDAKKERRRRRDGAQAHAPNSGCIFPPPHDHIDKTGSHNTSVGTVSSNTSFTHSHRFSFDKVADCKASIRSQAASLRGGTPGFSAPSTPGFSLSNAPPLPPPPPFPPQIMDVTHQAPTTPFAGQPQLLQPTPGYCYTLAESGQQIFIPASSFSSSAPSYSLTPSAQTTPVLVWNAPMQTTEANVKSNLPLLNPTANGAVVLMEDGRQYMLAPDAVNMNRQSSTSPTSSLVPIFAGSLPETWQGTSSTQGSYASGKPQSTNALVYSHGAVHMEGHQPAPLRSDGDDDFFCEAGVSCTETNGTVAGLAQKNTLVEKKRNAQ